MFIQFTPDLVTPERIIEHADQVPMPDGRTLAEWTPDERITERWYSLVLTPINERLFVTGRPTYPITGTTATQSWPNSSLRSVEQLRRFRLNELRGEYRRRSSRIVYDTNPFDTDPERLAHLVMLLQKPRDASFRLETSDGDLVAMRSTQFNAFIDAVAFHIEEKEIKKNLHIDAIQIADGPTLRDYDVTSGW